MSGEIALPKNSYTALYRRFRPRLFAEVVGQEHVTRTLQNALEKGRISHAYLFCGLRGTGKTTMAKLLAKALNCLEGVNREPCNRCRSCMEITLGRSMDVHEIDAASNRGIDEIRELREKVRYASAQNRYKVYIIDEVHMLTNEAFNALLKTLEEPPPGVVFILATTEAHKLPPTVISRCQRFDFHLLEAEQVVKRLAEAVAEMNFNIGEDSLYLLARQAEGSLRDAMGFLEQCRAYGGDGVSYEEVLEILGLASPEVIYRLLDCVIREDVAGGLETIRELVFRGRDLHRFLKELTLYLRKLVLLSAGGEKEKALADVPSMKTYLLKHQGSFDQEILLEMLELLQQLSQQLKFASQPQFHLELAFLRMVRAYRFRDYLSPGGLYRLLEELEEKMEKAGLGGLKGDLKPDEPPQPAGKIKPGHLSKESSPRVKREKQEPLEQQGSSPASKAGFPRAGLPERGKEGARGEEAKKDVKEKTAASGKGSLVAEEATMETGGGDMALPEAAADGEGISPDKLEDFWKNTLFPELRKLRKSQLLAYLQWASPLSWKKGVFTVAFPPGQELIKSRVESPQNKNFMELTLGKLLGGEVEFRVVFSERRTPAASLPGAGPAGKEAQPDKPTGEKPGKKAKENKGDEFFIRQMLELFNGQLIEAGEERFGSRDFWSYGVRFQASKETEDEVPF